MTAAADLVLTERDGPMVTITINRPEDDNRIDRATMDAIAAALARADADPSVRAAVITGRGDYFCAGGRIDGYPSGTVHDQLAFGAAFTFLQERMGRARVPLIAAVAGHCVFGGMSVLDACDLAIAVDTAEFGYPEITAGLFPMLAMAVARRGLPAKVAFDLFYSGRRIPAHEALTLHLVNEVVPRDRLWPSVRATVSMLASKSAAALTLGRRAFHAMGAMDPRAALAYAETTLVAMLRAAEDEARS